MTRQKTYRVYAKSEADAKKQVLLKLQREGVEVYESISFTKVPDGTFVCLVTLANLVNVYDHNDSKGEVTEAVSHSKNTKALSVIDSKPVPIIEDLPII